MICQDSDRARRSVTVIVDGCGPCKGIGNRQGAPARNVFQALSASRTLLYLLTIISAEPIDQILDVMHRGLDHSATFVQAPLSMWSLTVRLEPLSSARSLLNYLPGHSDMSALFDMRVAIDRTPRS